MLTDNDLFEEGKKLPLLEEFYTIQGEGWHTGKAAYFIRLGGCDIACWWCDSKISWQANVNQLVDVDEIIEKAKNCPAKAVVVTGGEPTLYNLEYLTKQLKYNDIQTFIETSGAYNLTGNWDWICLSPKIQTPPVKNIYLKANELKVIIFDDKSFAWAEENAKKVSENCKLLLQPEWSKYSVLIQQIVDYVKDNPKWSISLQAHKFMHIP